MFIISSTTPLFSTCSFFHNPNYLLIHLHPLALLSDNQLSASINPLSKPAFCTHQSTLITFNKPNHSLTSSILHPTSHKSTRKSNIETERDTRELNRVGGEGGGGGGEEFERHSNRENMEEATRNH